MSGFVLQVAFDDRLSAKFDELERFGGDQTPAMAEISRYFVSRIAIRFRTETDPLGAPWIKSKRAIRDGGQTLTDSGDLRRSMREDYGRDYAAAGPEASGGAAVYAAIHQTGFHGPVAVPFHTRQVDTLFGKEVAPYTQYVSSYMRQMNLPAREYLGFDPQVDGDAVIDILADHMGRALGGVVQ